MWHFKDHYKHQRHVRQAIVYVMGENLKTMTIIPMEMWLQVNMVGCHHDTISRHWKTEKGLEQIRRCDLLWKPRTTSIVCAFLLCSGSVAKMKESERCPVKALSHSLMALQGLDMFECCKTPLYYPDNFHHPISPSLRCRPNRQLQRNQRQSSGCRIWEGSRFQASLVPRRQPLGMNLMPLKIQNP